MRYEGKIALVTAGASGIGQATVERLVTEGAKIVFADIAEERGREIERQLKAQGAPVRFMTCDVTDEAQVAALVRSTVEEHGRIDAAFNIVGGQGPNEVIGRPLHECDAASWNRTVEINLGSPFLCMKYEIAEMLKTGGGAIANVSSMVGLRYSQHSVPSYAVAKAGVVHLTAIAAVEYADRNIRVNAVAPGLTATPALRTLPAEQLDGIVRAFHPNGRAAAPESQAATLVWLCSDDAIDITGLTIPVDGGWYAR